MADVADLESLFSGDVLVEPEDTARYLTDWRGMWTGKAIGVARPNTTQDVSAIVRWCSANRVALVPQGGNTGLSGGATPDESGSALVLSLERLTKVRSLDRQANLIEVEAGLTLAGVQSAAAKAGRLFPLSLAAEGTCQIGGVLSTNAGGTHVFRYGSARALCVGLEVVLPSCEVWRGNQALFKDNTGYAVRDLFIGAEGTLGIITAASLRLFPQPKGAIAVLVGLETLEDACTLYWRARDDFGPELTACEFMSAACVEGVVHHVEAARNPLAEPCQQYAILEVSSWESEERARERGLAWLEALFEDGLILDAVLSESGAQFEALWGLRENISESQSAENPVIKHDISVPLSKIAEFDRQCSAAMAQHFPQIEIQAFGHLGDGNLHYNTVPREGYDHEAFAAQHHAVNTLVHDLVNQFGGSISAEHGLGVLRRDEAARYKSTAQLDLMRAIKKTIDPLGIMNPGKVLSAEEH